MTSTRNRHGFFGLLFDLRPLGSLVVLQGPSVDVHDLVHTAGLERTLIPGSDVGGVNTGSGHQGTGHKIRMDFLILHLVGKFDELVGAVHVFFLVVH